VLDVGCGGGQMCGQLRAAGVDDVWGVDSSPYMLQHAARAYPGAKFAHSLAEQLDFPDRRFDGVSVCFVLHELPPNVARQALREIHRVLRPGGKLAICEPSDEQLRLSLPTLTRRFGLRGLYFGIFARRVFEPFVMAWHRLSATDVLRENGFDVVNDQRQMPIRYIYAVKR
jgi:ubiquinone/menaquinone biosynthesis C-methylase UbiE